MATNYRYQNLKRWRCHQSQVCCTPPSSTGFKLRLRYHMSWINLLISYDQLAHKALRHLYIDLEDFTLVKALLQSSPCLEYLSIHFILFPGQDYVTQLGTWPQPLRLTTLHLNGFVWEMAEQLVNSCASSLKEVKLSLPYRDSHFNPIAFPILPSEYQTSKSVSPESADDSLIVI